MSYKLPGPPIPYFATTQAVGTPHAVAAGDDEPVGELVWTDSGTAAVEVDLPAGPDDGQRVTVADLGNLSFAITVDPNGNTIDGSAGTISFEYPRETRTFKFITGQGWVTESRTWPTFNNYQVPEQALGTPHPVTAGDGKPVGHTVWADTSGGAFEVDLPITPDDGQIVRVVNFSGNNPITVDGNGNNVNGVASDTVTADREAVTYQYVNSQWVRVGISVGGGGAAATLSNYSTYKDILQTAPQVDWGLVLVGSATEPDATLAGVSAYSAPSSTTLQSTANEALPTLETGISVGEGSQVVLWNEPNAIYNGIYNLTQQGNGSQPWILTRATTGSKSESASLFGAIWEHYPTFDTANRNYVFVCLNTTAPTVGTDEIEIARLPADLFPVRTFYDTDVAAGQERNITRLYASRGGSGIHINHGLGLTINEGIVTHNGPTSDGSFGSHGGFVLAPVQHDWACYGGLQFGLRGYSETIPVDGAGGTTATMDTVVPDGAIIWAVGAYLPDGVASTNGGATWSFGWDDASTAFATAQAFGSGAAATWVATPHTQRTGTGSLRITASAGNLTGGTIRLSVIYGVASMPFGFV